MQEDKLIAGLDIGTTKVSCTLGRMNEYGHVEVLGHGTAPNEGVTKGLVTNIDKTVEAIKAAVAKAETQSDIEIKVVNVSISGQCVRSTMQKGSLTRPNREDEISAQDVRRLTQDMYRTVIPHGHKIIEVMPKEYTVDYDLGIKEPVGMAGARLEAEFHIVYSHVNAILSIEKAVKKANLEIDQFTIASLASSMACLTEDEKEMGVALVDIGGGTTDIAVFYDNIIRHTAVIPCGGNIITQDIKTGLGVMAQHAEALKCKFGTAIAEETGLNDIIAIPGLRNRSPKEISVRNLAHIIEARMQEIIELIHNEIIMSGFEDRLGAGIVITGGGSQLPRMQQLFEFMTGQECRIGYPNEYLARTQYEAVKTPPNATGMGLVLCGFRHWDSREGKYDEMNASAKTNKVVRNETGTPGKAGNFIKSFFDKTKGLLIDDVKETHGY